jgi:hypothetical protein
MNSQHRHAAMLGSAALGGNVADPYLEKLEGVLLSGVRDLHEAAEKMHLPFEAVCLTFNNGLRKGYWKIAVTTPQPVSKG